jgi:hypothetical protein
MNKPIYWNLSDAWNQAAVKNDRPLQPRSYIYASEIFGAKIDRWLKLKAIQPSNPPNDRSMRKFFAGNIWEYVVKQILLVCGLYHSEEIKVDATPFRNMLPVHGRLDFIAGGYVDKAEAMAKLKENRLPEILHGLAEKVIDSLAGQNLEKKILEIKSVSMFVHDYLEKRRKPLDYHVGQAYHYQRNNEFGYKADICYISKDTALLHQFGIDPVEVEPAYMKDIVQMTYYYTKNLQPPLEPLMGFDESVGNFSKNLKVEYSNYLSMLYGYASPDDYRRNISPTILRWNNVLGRYAKVEGGALTPTGKLVKISPENKEVRAEIIKSGYNFDELVQIKIGLSGTAEDDSTE